MKKKKLICILSPWNTARLWSVQERGWYHQGMVLSFWRKADAMRHARSRPPWSIFVDLVNEVTGKQYLIRRPPPLYPMPPDIEGNPQEPTVPMKNLCP